MSRLITTSFLDAVDWCQHAPDSLASNSDGRTWKQKAYDDIKEMLGRTSKWNPTPAITRGINFENQIYSILSNEAEEKVTCSDNFKKMLIACKGGIFQKKTRTIIELDDNEYCLYGKLDVWFKDHIIDIKSTAKYSGKDKYLGTAQHHIYCYSENIKDFEYLIAEFNDDSSNTIKAIHSVPYHMSSQEEEEEIIKNRIYAAMAFLEKFDEPGDLKDLYLTKYSRY